MGNLPQEPTSIQTEPSASPPEQFQQPSQGKWWKIGFLVTLLLFLATAGVLGFYVFKAREVEGTPVPTPTPTLAPLPTPTETVPSTPGQIVPTPTPDPRADWKTYTNSKYNYLVKIPKDWSIKEGNGFVFVGIPGEVTFLPPTEKDKMGYKTQIAITVMTTEKVRYSLNTQQQLEEWLTKEVSDGSGQRLFKIGNAEVGEMDAVKFISRALPGDPTEAFYSVVAWFRKNNTNYYIEFGGDERFITESLGVYNQILSTFQFLD